MRGGVIPTAERMGNCGTLSMSFHNMYNYMYSRC
jgi:hypothetical protein